MAVACSNNAFNQHLEMKVFKVFVSRCVAFIEFFEFLEKKEYEILVELRHS